MSSGMFGVGATMMRGARRGVMSSKSGNKHYFKGRGCNKTGFLTRKGKFVVDPFRIVSFVVPNLTECNLKPYVSFKGAKVESSVLTAEDLLAIGATPEDPGPEGVVQQGSSTSPEGFFGSLFGPKK